MSISHVIRDRDPKLTCRRLLLIINAVGESVPDRVIAWVITCIEGADGDIMRIKNWALAATFAKPDDDERVTPLEAVRVIRDICARRVAQ